jgi:RHS repeat-associated protein
LTLPNGIVVEYGYDDDSRLTGLTYTQGMSTLGTLTYAYDAAGQRTSVGGTYARTGLPAALASATYDDANQVATFGGTPFTYDANGNVTSDGTRSYTWNARNQLASLTGPVNGSFAYDGVGRRRSKTIGGTTTQFLYDGLNPVQELAGGTPSANLLTGVAIDEFFTRTDAAGVRNYLTDALGSSVALADGAGTIQTEYTYQPFGGTITSGTATANSFSFTGREADGTGLHYYRARYYDASVQRFIGEDPIGFLGGDASLYSYVSNSPQNFTDPEGLCIPIGPVAVSCIPAAAVAAADLAAYAAATLVALEVAQTISDRMSEHYAQHGKNKNTDSRWEGKTPEQLKEMYKNERNPAERKKLQKHLKDIDEKWSRHSNSRKSNRGGRGSGGGDGSGGGGSGGGKGSSGGGAGGSGSAAAAMWGRGK